MIRIRNTKLSLDKIFKLPVQSIIDGQTSDSRPFGGRWIPNCLCHLDAYHRRKPPHIQAFPWRSHHFVLVGFREIPTSGTQCWDFTQRPDNNRNPTIQRIGSLFGWELTPRGKSMARRPYTWEVAYTMGNSLRGLNSGKIPKTKQYILYNTP